MRLSLAVIFAALAATGCGAEAVHAAPVSSYSASSASLFGSGSGSGPTPVFVSRGSIPADAIVVAPDALDVPFTLIAEHGASNNELRQRGASLVEELRQRTGFPVELVPSSAAIYSDSSKKYDDDPAAARKITVGGQLRFALRAEHDFWSRLALVRTLSSEHRRLAMVKNAPVCAMLGTPEFRFVAPESQRPALVRKWIAAAKSVVAEAEKQEPTRLALTGCNLTRVEIAQSAIGPTEIALTLPIACSFGTAPVATSSR
jgi:hypothetical protein